MHSGSVQHCKGESDGWRLGREYEEVFFVTFVVSLVGVIVLRKEKENMRRSTGACMEENWSMSRSMATNGLEGSIMVIDISSCHRR